MTISSSLTGLVYEAVAGIFGAGLSWRSDMRRRKLKRITRQNWLSHLDVVCVAASIGSAVALLAALPSLGTDMPSLLKPVTFGILACALSVLFLWSEGKHQVQLQRPAGIVLGEWLILSGFILSATVFVSGAAFTPAVWVTSLLFVALGGLTIATIVPRFVRGEEIHRILDRVADAGEFTQQEYAAPTPECPYPERWKMLDAQSAEIEVLDFLRSFIETVKPELIVETGTFIGHSAIKMAEGLKANGFGKIVTIEYDPLVFAKAKQNIEESGLAGWIEYRNASSLDTHIEGPIDILFSDSDVNIRESEIRKFLPLIKPRGLILVHDSSSSFKVVREGVLRLEEEGLLSVVLLSTPRGMAIAQKRDGRT